MIQITRPKRVPKVLATKGAAATRANRTEFESGTRRFEFDNDLYGHKDVKKALIKAQHDKCCFCESKVTHVSNGHIEHYRPKGGFRQAKDEPLERPGYFWLAYEWTNLLFCCEVCNSRFKKNLFPLEDLAARSRTPSDDLSRENPLFIDPASEDPEEHIGYRQEYPFALDGSPRGEATWRALGLDREQLASVRRERLAFVWALRCVRDENAYPTAERANAAKLLEEMASAVGQWSAMVRAALAEDP